MSQDLKRSDSGIFCLPTPVESPMANRQVTIETQRSRPHSLLAQWGPMASLGIGSLPPNVFSAEEISRKAAEIVKMLDSPSNPTPEELQHVRHNSLALTTITEQETPLPSPTNECEYPVSQDLLHSLNPMYLRVGSDDKYFRSRDYYLNDVGPLGQGGFGTCLWGSDNTTRVKFALKRNSKNEEDKIQSIKKESAILSTLHHENIVFFYGAVLDTYSNARNCNMIMELAENGPLSDLLKDMKDQPSPLDVDQSLYYLEQILQGVLYLHNRSVMHLDIKTPNVLVFNSGKTVKLADFGSTMTYDTSKLGVCKKGATPLYAAPEIVREQPPRFASDVWSAHCVFVELITAKRPWCYHEKTNCISNESVIFKVGCYNDNMEDIVPMELDLDEEVLDLCRRVFKKAYTERPTAMALLETHLLIQAREYEKCFDGYVNELEDQQDNNSSLSKQELSCERSMEKLSITSSVGTTDDSNIDTSSYGQSPLWLPFKSHTQENQSPMASPSAQSFGNYDKLCCSAPSSMSSQRPTQRRLSLGITSAVLDPYVEHDRAAARCKAVQRSVSFSYAVQGPEIDEPEYNRPNSAQSSGYSSGIQTRKQSQQSLHTLSNQQSSTLIQSDQLRPLTQSNQDTKLIEHKLEKIPDCDGTRPMIFKYII